MLVTFLPYATRDCLRFRAAAAFMIRRYRRFFRFDVTC